MAAKGTIHFLSILSDIYGCGWYRFKAPNIAFMDRYNRAKITETFTPIIDKQFLQMMTCVKVQRMYSELHAQYLKALRQVANELGFRIIYDIDDIIVSEDMPKYNVASKFFEGKFDSLKTCMEQADQITVTNEFLARYYSQKMNIPLERFFVIPNYIPKWWFGYHNNVGKSVTNLSANKNKPRIAFACSFNHFDAKHLNNDIDDFSEITPWIIDNRKKYQFIFLGGMPEKCLPYVKDFEIANPSTVFMWAQTKMNLKANLYIQPLQPNMFNIAKSNIKLLEAWAEGVPIIAQDIPNYRAFDSENIFKNNNELDNKVNRLLRDNNCYKKTINNNWNKMQSFWLENHMELYARSYMGKP